MGDMIDRDAAVKAVGAALFKLGRKSGGMPTMGAAEDAIKSAIAALPAATMGSLEWVKTIGGSYSSGPYRVTERIDGNGWNATALFVLDSRDGHEANFHTTILLAGTRAECVEACEKAHKCILAALAPSPADEEAVQAAYNAMHDERMDKPPYDFQADVSRAFANLDITPEERAAAASLIQMMREQIDPARLDFITAARGDIEKAALRSMALILGDILFGEIWRTGVPTGAIPDFYSAARVSPEFDDRHNALVFYQMLAALAALQKGGDE
jgi:hypothetical protein